MTQYALRILNRSDCTYSQLILSSLKYLGGKFAQVLAHKRSRLWMLSKQTAQPLAIAVVETVGIPLISTAKNHHHFLPAGIAPDEHDVGRQGDHVPVDR